jgi:tetratricopeptide (TPR) repeat protein
MSEDTGDREAQAEDLELVLERAHLLGEEGDWEGMAEHLRHAMEDFPGDPFLLCWLGVAEREMGMEGVAYERFKACLAAQPTDPYVLATAGNAMAAFDDPDAEVALRAAALTAPDLPLARWMYGAYLSREGYTDRAVDELKAAAALDPDDPVIAFELGVAFALGGERATAIEALFRAGELDPEDGWPRAVLGLLLLEEDRVEEAAAELSAAARLRPEDVEAQFLAALAATAAGLDDLGWEMLERGRQRAEGGDREVAEELDDRLSQGPEEALDFLRTRLGPTALRERLLARP